MRTSWWHTWFEGRVAGDAEALQVLLTRICRQEAALAFHLADRARAVRFAPHRLSLEGLAERERQNAHAMAREIGGGATQTAATCPARRPGTLTATKLIQDLVAVEDLYTLYRQARWLTPDTILRDTLEGMAADEDRSSQTIRRILGTMDSYVTDRPSQGGCAGHSAVTVPHWGIPQTGTGPVRRHPKREYAAWQRNRNNPRKRPVGASSAARTR